MEVLIEAEQIPNDFYPFTVGNLAKLAEKYNALIVLHPGGDKAYIQYANSYRERLIPGKYLVFTNGLGTIEDGSSFEQIILGE